MPKYYICLAYNDNSNRNAHEKKKHGAIYTAGSINEIKEDCETLIELKQNNKCSVERKTQTVEETQ